MGMACLYLGWAYHLCLALAQLPRFESHCAFLAPMLVSHVAGADCQNFLSHASFAAHPPFLNHKLPSIT